MPRERAEAIEIVSRVFGLGLNDVTREFLIGKLQETDKRFCSHCFQTGQIYKISAGFVRTSSCLCKQVIKRNIDILKSFQESNIPLLYQGAMTADWINKGRDEKEIRLNQASFHAVDVYSKKITSMRKNGYGIFMCGPHGVGKTFLACAIGNSAIKSRYAVRYFTMAEIINQHIRGWYNDDAKLIVDSIRECDFLIIDDVDKMHRTKNEIESSLFDNLLRERLQRKMPCIFTSNRTLDQAREDYGSSIHSMLIEQCAELIFLGDDHRKKKSDDIRRGILGS